MRWRIKKTARQLMAALSYGSGVVWLKARRSARPQVRVLTYHRVREADRDPFSVSAAEFSRQMAWLAARGLAVSLDDVLAFLDGQRSLPHGSVLVTIDDGYTDLATAALPILQRYRIPAVAFVPAGELGQIDAEDGTRRLSQRELAALCGNGVAVGSHSWDHASLGRMSPIEVNSQAVRSRSALEQIAGQSILAFAYPFGTRVDFNRVTGEILRDAGYGCAFTSQHGPVARDSNRFELCRVKIEGGDPFWVFALAVRGGLDGWGLIDRFAAPFQATGFHSVAPRASKQVACP